MPGEHCPPPAVHVCISANQDAQLEVGFPRDSASVSKSRTDPLLGGGNTSSYGRERPTFGSGGGFGADRGGSYGAYTPANPPSLHVLTCCPSRPWLCYARRAPSPLQAPVHGPSGQPVLRRHRG